MSDATSQLRSATRRAKSDVANKLVSMFLHELSRRLGRDWRIRVESAEYEELVRSLFGNRCPYCSCELSGGTAVIEHLDGMNRQRAGLHLPGNVLVACRRCNSEKRRDDAAGILSLAISGWESFMLHDGRRCTTQCATCIYWQKLWPNRDERELHMRENLERIRSFRRQFPELAQTLDFLKGTLPTLLGKLYTDCQDFAEREIKSLLESFECRADQGRTSGDRSRPS